MSSKTVVAQGPTKRRSLIVSNDSTMTQTQQAPSYSNLSVNSRDLTQNSASITRQSGSRKAGKKLLLIHLGDNVKRIAFSDTMAGEAIERSIRRECGILGGPFSLIDEDGDSVVVDGSMEPGEFWIAPTEMLYGNETKRKTKRATRVARTPPDFSKIEPETAIKHIFDPVSRKWSTSPIKIRLDSVPFASGSLRRAHYIQLSDDEDTIYVAKTSLDQDEDKETYMQDIQMQMYAKEYAKQFNTYNPPKHVDFIMAFLITLCDRENKPLWGVEKYIEGTYRKHNNNWGYVNEAERSTPQAFSHFTYEVSDHKVLICDIQGVGDLYTDPQMHTEESMYSFGKGNMRSHGFDRFLKTHRCNAICKYLKLPPINEKSNMDFGTIPEQTFMPQPRIEIIRYQIAPSSPNDELQIITPSPPSQPYLPLPPQGSDAPTTNSSETCICCVIL